MDLYFVADSGCGWLQNIDSREFACKIFGINNLLARNALSDLQESRAQSRFEASRSIVESPSRKYVMSFARDKCLDACELGGISRFAGA
jgi:hypothetical protein